MKNKSNPKKQLRKRNETSSRQVKKKKMTLNIDKFVRTLVWFLVMQVTVVSYAKRGHFVTTELKIRNGMQGLMRPEIVYNCKALKSGLDYGWRRSTRPPLGHAFYILLEGGEKLEEEIHRCHFRSVLGTIDVDIRMTVIEAEICNLKKECAVHEVTPEGIRFEGKEWDFTERYPRLVPRKYLEGKWKPWPKRSRSGPGRKLPSGGSQ